MIRALIACAVAACASTPNLALRPDPTPPAGSTTEVFVARDRTQLLARHWPASDPRGVVVIMHGLKDHSARYATFAKRLADAGYTVFAFDLRGHGRSAGPRVAPDEWDDYVDDLDRFVTHVEGRAKGKPVFVFGHSMGGAIATLVAIRRNGTLPGPRIAGLILSAPALVLDISPLLLAATRMTGALMPRFPALELDNDDFSSDPYAAKQLASDPLISQARGPARTAAGLVNGIHRIWTELEGLTVPVLALHGDRDELTAPSGSRALVGRAPARDRMFRLYPNLAHDLLHEPTGKQVEDEIVRWLHAHTGGPPVVSSMLYDLELAGDPEEWTQAIELSGGVVTKDDRVHWAASAALNLGRWRPVGWHGALTARFASNYNTVSLRPVGAAVRMGPAVLGVSGGVALVSEWDFATSGGAFLEVPVGPIHVGAAFELARTFRDLPYEHGPIAFADFVWTNVSLRYGADREYWPHTRAGVGPVISGGSAWYTSAQAWHITVGLQLYGVD